MDLNQTLQSMGWPEGETSGSLYWMSGDRTGNHMNACISLSKTGELTMSSQVTWGERSQQRFNAMVPAGKDTANVSMPGYERQDVPIDQAIALFRAHTAGLESQPIFNPSRAKMAP